MARSTKDVWVGLLVVIGLVSVLFLALKAANLLQWNFEKNYAVTARFDNIGGLKPGAAVKSAGVVVGRVASITLDPQTYQAKATLELDAAAQFPKDSSASILTAGLLGEQYIGLEAGADDKMLASGDKIKQTSDALVLEKLISQFLFSKAADGAPKEGAEGKKP